MAGGQDNHAGGTPTPRSFVHREDAISFYSDYIQVIAPKEEIILNVYETIPGPPSPSGGIESAESRLRATIVMSKARAQRLGELLTGFSKDTGA